jgi:hypothetical protein
MEKELRPHKEQREIITCIDQGINGLREVDVVEAVRCTRCRSLLRRDSEDYLTIKGNIFVGDGGGVLGNGDWEKHGIPFYHYCINGCFSHFIGELEEEQEKENSKKDRE